MFVAFFTILGTGYWLFTERGHNQENLTERGNKMDMMPPVALQTRTTRQPQPPQTNPLREKAAQLETAFLAEMLSHAGLGTARESFGGGIGEEQFSSFLRQEQAAAMVKAGGIGLTEALFQALSGAESGADNAAK
jgi:flagellar protein FlgJ